MEPRTRELTADGLGARSRPARRWVLLVTGLVVATAAALGVGWASVAFAGDDEGSDDGGFAADDPDAIELPEPGEDATVIEDFHQPVLIDAEAARAAGVEAEVLEGVPYEGEVVQGEVETEPGEVPDPTEGEAREGPLQGVGREGPGEDDVVIEDYVDPETGVSCDQVWWDSGVWARAYAEGCEYAGTADVRLEASCAGSDNTVYSAWIGGPLTNASFTTRACVTGINETGFETR